MSKPTLSSTKRSEGYSLMEYDADLAVRVQRGATVTGAYILIWACGHVMHIANGDTIPMRCPDCKAHPRITSVWTA